MTRKLLLFFGGSLALWLLTGLPAWYFWGETALVDSLVALGLCVVPMAATLVLAQLAAGSKPEDQLAAAFGGTGIRMVVVILAGVALFSTVAELHHDGFLFAVVGYYLATLALEMLIVVGVPTNVTQPSGDVPR